MPPHPPCPAQGRGNDGASTALLQYSEYQDARVPRIKIDLHITHPEYPHCVSNGRASREGKQHACLHILLLHSSSPCRHAYLADTIVFFCGRRPQLQGDTRADQRHFPRHSTSTSQRHQLVDVCFSRYAVLEMNLVVRPVRGHGEFINTLPYQR